MLEITDFGQELVFDWSRLIGRSAKVVFALHCIGKGVDEIGILEVGWGGGGGLIGVKQKLKLTGQTLLTLFCIPRKGFITITLSVISTKTWF